MAISFHCQCGKKMTAKEEFSGRRLRCPECQRVVTIPRPGSSAVIAPRAESPPSGNTLTAAELAALRREMGDTQTPARQPTFHDMGNFFNDAPTAPAAKTPAPRPSAPVEAATPPPAPPPFTGPHPWIDQTLVQSATSWQADDEERYQADVAPAHEREFPMGWLGAAIIFGSLAAMAMLS